MFPYAHRLFAAFLLFALSGPVKAQITPAAPDDLILSVNAYSFNDLLIAKDRTGEHPVYTLFNLLDWCATQDIRALDATGYYFPGYPAVPSDDYLRDIKAHADRLGIAFSGTGIRNDFASPDPEVRREGVALAKAWIEVAAKLDAPVIRVFAGHLPDSYADNWDEPAGWLIDCIRELLPVAERHGVKIGIQNHGDMLWTAEQCRYVLETLDSEWAGLIVDTGNFRVADPYADIAAMIPFAVNWQVKERLDINGTMTPIDLDRIIRIIHDEGYSGYLPVETLVEKGRPYDPFARLTTMMAGIRTAIDRTYAE